MSNPHADRRHAVRGPSGRWERRQDPAEGQAELPDPAPELPDPAPAAPPARDARDARGASSAPFRLNITAEDVTPAAPGSMPTPPPAGLDVDPAVDVPAARMIAAAINTAVDMAGLPPATAPELDKVSAYAAPVMRRAATRFGLGDAVGSTVPEWVVEAGNLAIAVGVAWGPAGAVVIRTAIARRSAGSDEDAPDAEPYPAGRGNERARATGGDNPATGGGDAAGGRWTDEGSSYGGPGPRQPGPLDADGLASIFAAPGIRGPRAS